MTEHHNIARRTLLVGSAAAAAVAGLGIMPAEAVNPKRRTDFAIWDPVSDRSAAALTPRRVIMHIADSDSRDIYGPGRVNDSYAHFYNRRSGAPRQHQTLNKQAAADRDAIPTSISVEHQGREGDAMTGVQITNLAKIFAWAHVFCGVPNRIATVDNTEGLAWHRLGIDGNFGAYDPNDRTTWCRDQTRAFWSYASGKTCPTNKFIRKIPEVFDRAQFWINFYTNPPPN